jgi:hypothetical protein
MKSSRTRAAQTLVELLCAVVVTMIVLAGAMTGLIALQKSLADSTQYAAGFNDGTRLVGFRIPRSAQCDPRVAPDFRDSNPFQDRLLRDRRN